jgi:DNA/RNA-binding domain of Phe-tRNA-synthetase-like protein
MSEPTDPRIALAEASVDPAIFERWPGYRALLIGVCGVRGGPSDAASDAALRRAEQAARIRLAGAAPDALPQIAAWRGAFLEFGVKPRHGRSSVEAMLRRVDGGLPRIDRLTDLYNAISVEHLIPVGGENLDSYRGRPRLVLARGDEPFDTIADGEPVVAHPEPGEPVWRDDIGVTCRRWNWRQCVRTRLDTSTENVLFILDGLSPVSDSALHAAADALIKAVIALAPGASTETRVLSAADRDAQPRTRRSEM